MVLAVAIASSRLLAAAIQPWAVVLQVTPIVAIAPLIIVWVGDPFASLVVCATIVAFFPVFANTAAGLASAPAELADLFRLYGASRFATLWLLRLPAALPYFLAGLRISGGLALVGAVVAEFVAGSGGFASGLAYRILEAGYRLQVPRMFAALVLLSLAGIAINFGLGAFAADGDAAARRRLRLAPPQPSRFAGEGACSLSAKRGRVGRRRRYSAASRHPVGRTACCNRSRYAACQSSAASTASPLRTCRKMSG